MWSSLVAPRSALLRRWRTAPQGPKASTPREGASSDVSATAAGSKSAVTDGTGQSPGGALLLVVAKAGDGGRPELGGTGRARARQTDRRGRLSGVCLQG